MKIVLLPVGQKFSDDLWIMGSQCEEMEGWAVAAWPVVQGVGLGAAFLSV
jgi:hypothetical protein